MQLVYELKTAISASIPQQLTANCSSVRQLPQQQPLSMPAAVIQAKRKPEYKNRLKILKSK